MFYYFFSNKIKLNINWYISANATDVVNNFAVIKSISIKSVDCIQVTKLNRVKSGIFGQTPKSDSDLVCFIFQILE